MFYKEQFNFRDLVAADFGLSENDQDTHTPQFLLLTKTTETATSGAAYRAIFRGRSDAGKQRDKDRKKTRRWEKRVAKAVAAQEEALLRSTTSKASSSRSSWE